MNRAALVTVLLAACSPIPLGDGPRKEVLRAIGDEVIVPGYADLAGRAGELATAARAAVPALDPPGLTELQARWRALRVAWMRTQAYRLGPVRDDLYEGRVAQWPVDPLAVEALIADAVPVDRALIDAQGGNKKGMAIAEYLLFAAPGGGDVVGALAEPRRQAYLIAVLDAIAADTAALAAAWNHGYAGRFVAVGAPGAPFATIKDGVDAVVNAQVFLAENVADGRLGKPLGSMTGGVPQPGLVESPWSDHGAADVVAAYDGLAAILEGDGPRLGDLIADHRPAVEQRVQAELAAARAAVLAMPRPLTDAVAQQAPAVDAAWVAARALKMTYQAEVVSALGATLSFNDNDGD